MSKENNKTGLGFDLPDDADVSIDVPKLGDPDIVENSTVEEKPSDTPVEEPAPAPKKQPEKEFENPQARARILEREKRERDGHIRDLEIELSRMREQFDKMNEKKVEKEEDIDPELSKNDPLAYIAKKVDLLEREIKKSKEESASLTAAAKKQNVLEAADKALSTGAERFPDTFVPAVKHVAKIIDRHVAKNFKHLKTSEQRAAAEEMVNEIKFEMISNGVDPVLGILEMAEDLGWVAPEKKAEEVEDIPSTPKDKQPKAKEDKPEAKRESVAASLGGMTGAPPQKFTAKAILTPSNPMNSESEYHHKIRQLQKAGVLSKSKTNRAGLPPLSERLPGKGRRV